MPDDIHFQVLRTIQKNPEISQRQLASELGVSLGKTNYCLKALLDKGWVKINNFRNKKNKLAYAYLLTPRGIEAKAELTLKFLKWKMEEYETLKQEIEELQKEQENARTRGSEPSSP